MHGSLLPKYRGRAPVHWAIIHGETATGASLHYMVEKPDAGRAGGSAIGADPGKRHGARRVAQSRRAAAKTVLRRSLPRLSPAPPRRGRSNLAKGSYFGRRTPEDGRIDWRQGARQVHDLVRAVAPPFPGAFTEVNGCRLEVLETRLDDASGEIRRPGPCLYAADGEWYADCVDGRAP